MDTGFLLHKGQPLFHHDIENIFQVFTRPCLRCPVISLHGSLRYFFLLLSYQISPQMVKIWDIFVQYFPILLQNYFLQFSQIESSSITKIYSHFNKFFIAFIFVNILIALFYCLIKPAWSHLRNWVINTYLLTKPHSMVL